MILSSLQVSTFAALRSLSLNLAAGMNVILGPNEAGKSTLFKALQHLLLTPVKLRQRSFQELILPLLPVGGGDTISASLEFRVEGRSFRLDKKWGGSTAAELFLPDGSRITAAEDVERRLAELLPVPPGTLRSVLLTVQSGLTTTMEELQGDKETVYGLSDLLHRSVLETDGISVRRFQELLEQRCQEYLGHWDSEHQRPERKRSGDKRWTREIGSVLEAYYTLEDIEQRYREVQESETAFGALVEQLETCSSELAGKEKELQNIEPGAKDAEQRSVLEVKLENTELSLKEVQGDYESWTKKLLQSEALEKELPSLQKELEALEQERVQVQTFARSRELRERFEGLRNKRERWKKLEAELKQLLPVSRSRLNQLRDCATEIDRLKASLEAGNLSLVFRTNEAVDLLVHKDMEAPAKQHLRENKSLDIEAAGKIELHHPNWSLEVYSGKGEFDKLAEKYKHAQSRFQKLLKELQVISIEQAQEASERYETRAEEIRAAQTLYEQELGQDSFEALETACGEQIEAHPSRELNQVLEELVEKQAQVRQAESRLEEARKTFEKLKKQYQSRDALFARVAELGGLKQQLNREMAGLAPLPKGYSDARSLIQSYKGLKEEIETLKREKIRLQSDCRNAEATLPDESSEESHCRLEDVKEIFSKRVDKAAVLVRIQQAVAALLEEIDRGLYDPFTTLVSRYLASLSDNRYREVPSSASLPAAVLRSDGQALPYDLLSAGTRDIFALAVRLAMAEFFLGNAEGFLVLDDPLVDLDPQRRQQAAAVLAEFPHQLLIFTCHPAHADLLGKANRIELERV